MFAEHFFIFADQLVSPNMHLKGFLHGPLSTVNQPTHPGRWAGTLTGNISQPGQPAKSASQPNQPVESACQPCQPVAPSQPTKPASQASQSTKPAKPARFLCWVTFVELRYLCTAFALDPNGYVCSAGVWVLSHVEQAEVTNRWVGHADLYPHVTNNLHCSKLPS